MSIRSKIILILVAASLACVGYLYRYWLPKTEKSSIEQIVRESQRDLRIVSEMLIPLIIQDDLALIHENLNELEQSDDWVAVILRDKSGDLLYPLDQPLEPSGSLIQKLDHEISLRGRSLGQVTLWINPAPALEIRKQEYFNLVSIMAIGFLAIFAIVTLLIDRSVTRPIRRVSEVAKELARGNYDAELPAVSKDEVGALVSSFETMRTDIRDQQAELSASRDAAEQANMAKSQFLSSMSHELRTPLNAVLGFSQLLIADKRTPLTDRQAISVNQISKSGGHLLELIDQVLDLSRIESGNLSVSIEAIDPESLIDDCLSMIGTMAREKDLRVDFSGLDQIGGRYVRADRVRMRQVLLNLLMNAVKYNTTGERIALICGFGQDGFLRFEVTDDGPGIPLAKQGDIFKPFNRLGMEAGEIEGTGIGLTISRELVALMGGQIGFVSEEGEGATFWFELPETEGIDPGARKRQASPELLAEVTERSDGDARYRILYVEDNPANLMLMEGIIEQVDDTELISAHNAELGLLRALKDRPHLILMDINLPGMSGIEALKELQASPETADIPVVAISAAAMPSDIARARQAGFKWYLTKPVDVIETLRVIEEALKR